MYSGPGPGSLSAAAAMWEGLATESHAATGYYRSVISGLTAGRWMGPASLSMASAFAPFMAWTAGVAARAAETASQARLAVEAYEAAFAMTVPPPAVFANRARLAALVATNFFGQNSPAIAATEAEYGEMWARDAIAMYEYAAHSAVACTLTPLVSPPEVVNPAGVTSQATAVANAAAVTPAQQLSLAGAISSIPATLQSLVSPVSSFASSPASTLTNLMASVPSEFAVVPAYALPNYINAAVTPLYGMSAILSIAQTTNGLMSAAAAGAASAASQAANAATSGAAALGSGVAASLGNAASLGPLSVPASWTSVIPAAQVSAVTALPNAGINGLNAPPSLLSAAPRAALAGAGRSLGPRYGIIPTVMTRPPSGGYA